MTCYHTQGTNIVHLTSQTALGPYSFADVALGAETNNPHVTILGDGNSRKWVLVHTNDNKPVPQIASCSGVPSSSPFRNTSNLQECVGCTDKGSIGIATSNSAAGPWKTVFPFVGAASKNPVSWPNRSLANPSALVLDNGTIMLAYRYSSGLTYKQSEAVAVSVADSAAGPWTFLNIDVSPLNIEDPVLYKTKRGYHFAAHQYNSTWQLHNGTLINVQYDDPRMASGAHLGVKKQSSNSEFRTTNKKRLCFLFEIRP